MKKKSAFARALETSDGRMNFFMMIMFIGLTFVVSALFADRRWYEVVVWIVSCMSLICGGNFCKTILAIKMEDNKTEKK